MSIFDAGPRDALQVSYAGAAATALVTVTDESVILEAPAGTVVGTVDLTVSETIAAAAAAITAVPGFTGTALNGFGAKPALAGLESLTGRDVKTAAIVVRRPPVVVDQIARDRLLQIAETFASGVTLYPNYVWAKLLAAEADAERQLRVFFGPVEMLPEGTTQAEIDALPAGTRWLAEPAYDWGPSDFQGDRWGYLVTRQRPIIAVAWMRFAYPIPVNTIFEVPGDWIHVDHKYGHIRLVPTGTPFGAPLSAYVMSVVGGGRNIPHMLRVRYTAGLKDALADYPDLVDLLKKMAVLRILGDRFLPQSGSISADGLSQSLSIDYQKYQDAVEHQIDTLRQAIHGVRMMVV